MNIVRENTYNMSNSNNGGYNLPSCYNINPQKKKVIKVTKLLGCHIDTKQICHTPLSGMFDLHTPVSSTAFWSGWQLEWNIW